MQAARLSGVSKSYVYQLHHSLGGVYRPPHVEYSDRYLDRDERYELARLLEAGPRQRRSPPDGPLAVDDLPGAGPQS